MDGLGFLIINSPSKTALFSKLNNPSRYNLPHHGSYKLSAKFFSRALACDRLSAKESSLPLLSYLGAADTHAP